MATEKETPEEFNQRVSKHLNETVKKRKELVALSTEQNIIKKLVDASNKWYNSRTPEQNEQDAIINGGLEHSEFVDAYTKAQEYLVRNGIPFTQYNPKT